MGLGCQQASKAERNDDVVHNVNKKQTSGVHSKRTEK